MKELEDYAWFPQVLRRMQMEYIGWLAIKLGLYSPVVPIAKALIKSSACTHIMDLCTGTAMPAEYLHSRLNLSKEPHLSDLYPDREGIDHLDVTAIDSGDLDGLITMCNAFHHFDQDQQQKILTAIAESSQPALIIEILEPTLLCYLQVLMGTTVGQLLLAPFVKPFSLLRLLLTYLIPINLLTITYDGLISVSKSKTKQGYRQMLNESSTAVYEWKAIRKTTSWLTTVTILQGQPL